MATKTTSDERLIHRFLKLKALYVALDVEFEPLHVELKARVIAAGGMLDTPSAYAGTSPHRYRKVDAAVVDALVADGTIPDEAVTWRTDYHLTPVALKRVPAATKPKQRRVAA